MTTASHRPLLQVIIGSTRPGALRQRGHPEGAVEASESIASTKYSKWASPASHRS